MLQHTSSEVTVGYITIKFKCYGERLEPNLKEMTIVKKKMIIYRPILKSARKYKQIYKASKENVSYYSHFHLKLVLNF